MNSCDFTKEADKVISQNKTLRYIAMTMTVLLLLVLVYTSMLLMPVNWLWFNPTKVVIADTQVDTQPPKMGYDREILQDTRMRYNATIRKLPGLRIVCNETSGVFMYRSGTELPEDDDLDIGWWTEDNENCTKLSTGSYIMTTCWTVTRPFWGLVPPKTICLDSNTFTITEEKP